MSTLRNALLLPPVYIEKAWIKKKKKKFVMAGKEWSQKLLVDVIFWHLTCFMFSEYEMPI